MAIVKPFKALRPKHESAPKVASVPYDVVNEKEAATLAEGNPVSFLRITRSEIELPNDIDHYDPKVYQKAKENLERIKKEAPLFTEENPHYYIYQLEMDGRVQTGVGAVFAVDDYDNNIILKHEKTRKEKEDDRTNHIITTKAQTGSVFLTYRGVDRINFIIDNVIKSNKPDVNFIAPDGIRHTVYTIPSDLNEKLEYEFNKVDKLYIADGHHRAASASRARKVMMENNPQHTGNEEYNFFIAVLFPAEQLHIMPYNRVVKDLNGKSKEKFLNEVSEKFVIAKTNKKEPEQKNFFGMYLDGDWYELKASDAILASNSLSNSVGEKLDVSILQNFLLNPVLGIDDPRTNKRIDFVGGIRGTSELERLVNSGLFAVAFSLYPVSVNDLMNISDANEIMPPKSTWFEPKLRDGLLVHLI